MDELRELSSDEVDELDGTDLRLRLAGSDALVLDLPNGTVVLVKACLRHVHYFELLDESILTDPDIATT